MDVYYVYIINHSNQVAEVSGVLTADSPEDARSKLSALGVVIKEVRTATAAEVKLDNLKKFRNKLQGDVLKQSAPQPLPLPEVVKLSINVELLVLFLVVILVVVYCFGR